MKKEIIPSNWRDSMENLKGTLSNSIQDWIERLRPEDRIKARTEIETTLLPNLLEDFSGWKWPSLDAREDEDSIVLRVDVPGMSKKDLKVDLSMDSVHIVGEHSSTRKGKKGGARYAEASYGAFERTIPLPCPVDADHIRAKCRDGVLQLTLPKATRTHARRIPVSDIAT